MAAHYYKESLKKGNDEAKVNLAILMINEGK